MRKLILFKNGEKEEIELEYKLKDTDRVEKINGKWCLVRKAKDDNVFKEFLNNNKVEIVYTKDEMQDATSEEKLFEVKVTSINLENGETHETVILENAPFEWLK